MIPYHPGYSGNIWADMQDQERERREALFTEEDVPLMDCMECQREVSEIETSRNWGVCDRCAMGKTNKEKI